jgi:hypothetical protein
MYLTDPVCPQSRAPKSALRIRFGGGVAISYVIDGPAGKTEDWRELPGGVVASSCSS